MEKRSSRGSLPRDSDSINRIRTVDSNTGGIGSSETDLLGGGSTGLVFNFSGYQTPNAAPSATIVPSNIGLPLSTMYPADHASRPTTTFAAPNPPTFYLSRPDSAAAVAPTNSVERTASHQQYSTLGQIAARFKEDPAFRKGKTDPSEDSKRTQVDEREEEGDDDGGEGEEGQDQSTGRWTKKEHELFLAALKKYGKVGSVWT